MPNKIIVATSPDDSGISGLRICAVDLNTAQENLLSLALQETSVKSDIVIYNWKQNDSVSWLLDKKVKSDLVIFNADMYNQIVCGFLAAFNNSYYFGILKDIDIYNSNCLISKEDLEKTFIKYEGIYERKFI